MSLKRHLWGINEEVKMMVNSQFDVNVSSTSTVPKIDSGSLTFPDFKNDKLAAVEIETCVLFIDIRKSTTISSSHRRPTLAKLYSAFVRAMVQAAEYYGGKVRNIIGDRVMVVFDAKDCFENSVNTAILLNTVSDYIINKHFKHNEIKCGIGIDHGKLLVVKTGTIKRSDESREYKSLVWLGNACNMASKLTDMANKEIDVRQYKIQYMDYYYRWLGMMPRGGFSPFFDIGQKSNGPTLVTKTLSEDEFLGGIKDSKSGVGFNYSISDIKSIEKIESKCSIKPILISEVVFKGFEKACPNDKSITNNWWKIQDINNKDIKGKIYGSSVIFTAGKKLK